MYGISYSLYLPTLITQKKSLVPKHIFTTPVAKDHWKF